jgi:hypothetical protein
MVSGAIEFYQCAAVKRRHINIMFRNSKHIAVQAAPRSHSAIRNLGGMARRLGFDLPFASAATAAASHAATNSASWPTGVSLLAQMVDACQRCDATEVCND